MNHAQYVKRFAAAALGASLLGLAPTISADQIQTPSGAAYGMGPGMMSGYGGGMMGGYGAGRQGAGGGYGMMPGCGGYGMGPGMMMGGFWGSGLDLTDEQQAKINKIQDETRRAHWALMGAMMDQQAKLRDLYAAPKQDSAAIDEAYKSLGKLQQEMFSSSVEAQKRMEALLTQEQKEQLRNYWRRGGWMRGQ